MFRPHPTNCSTCIHLHRVKLSVNFTRSCRCQGTDATRCDRWRLHAQCGFARNAASHAMRLAWTLVRVFPRFSLLVKASILEVQPARKRCRQFFAGKGEERIFLEVKDLILVTCLFFFKIASRSTRSLPPISPFSFTA